MFIFARKSLRPSGRQADLIRFRGVECRTGEPDAAHVQHHDLIICPVLEIARCVREHHRVET
jgi:hypothetical protein